MEAVCLLWYLCVEEADSRMSDLYVLLSLLSCHCALVKDVPGSVQDIHDDPNGIVHSALYLVCIFSHESVCHGTYLLCV